MGIQKKSDSIVQYLNRYAEKQAVGIANHFPQLKYRTSVVLPVMGEKDINITISSLQSAARSRKTSVLAIIVLNARENSSDEIFIENEKVLASYNTTLKILDSPPTYLATSEYLSLLIIDRSTKLFCFRNREGVGLARKLGSDTALALYHREVITGEWIFTTDADAQVPYDYLGLPKTYKMIRGLCPNDIQAMALPFRHATDSDLEVTRATHLYDRYLRYYLAGLEYAGSPYAFHTLGSTLAFTAYAYACVRGFPNRMAAEDFYFLNKISKVVGIGVPELDPIVIQYRKSTRVPFGTANSVEKILALLAEGQNYSVYNPQCFQWLKVWLDQIAEYCEDRNQTRLRDSLIENSSVYCEQILESMGVFSFLELASRQLTANGKLLRFIHCWFDAFRTLKFIRACDKILPQIPIQEVPDDTSQLFI